MDRPGYLWIWSWDERCFEMPFTSSLWTGGPLCELMAVSPTVRGWVVALMSHYWVYRCLAEEVFASLSEAGLEMSWIAVSED